MTLIKKAFLSIENDMALGEIQYIECPYCGRYQTGIIEPRLKFEHKCQNCSKAMLVDWNEKKEKIAPTKILIILGKNDEFLTYKTFQTEEEMDKFVESLHNLVILNIEDKMPLRKRLLSLPKDANGEYMYFPMAGAVQNFEYIDLDPQPDEDEDKNDT